MYSLSTSGMAELWFRCFEYYHAYRILMCRVGSKICGLLDEIPSVNGKL